MRGAREFLGGLKEGFAAFGLSVATVINFALLSFVYVFGIGLTSAAARAKGKHFLDLRPRKEAASYFVSAKMAKEKTEDYYRQF